MIRTEPRLKPRMEILQKMRWDDELVPSVLRGQILVSGRGFILNFRMKVEFHPSHPFHPKN